MAFAVSIKAADPTGSRPREHRSGFSAFQPAPSIVALEYPPHITLAAYGHINEVTLRETLTTVFAGGQTLRPSFHALRYLDDPLATEVSTGNKARAINLASRPIEAFAVVFGTADCVESCPVGVIEECSPINV